MTKSRVAVFQVLVASAVGYFQRVRERYTRNEVPDTLPPLSA